MRGGVLAATLALSLAASAASAKELLYCSDTDVAGFAWNSGKAQRTFFKPERYTVTVISDTERIITRTIGDSAGTPGQYRCERALVDPPDYFFSCNGEFVGMEPWTFKGNAFTRAFLMGGPVGADPNITIAYGHCIKF